MEKRPPANVGDLERQREKYVHLLHGEERVPGEESCLQTRLESS
jgi:hypothetical protein